MASQPPASARTGKMHAGRQADSARRRQRVITAIDQASTSGSEISVSGIARMADVDRTFPLLAPRPARKDPRPGSKPARRRRNPRPRRHPRVAAGRPARRARARRPPQRTHPAARKTPLPGARRASLAAVRPRHARRHRRAEQQDHPARTASRRAAPPAQRTRQRTRRRPGSQPRAHGPAQRHSTPHVTSTRASTTPVAPVADNLKQPDLRKPVKLVLCPILSPREHP
jgi:hypothetical protein